MKRFDFAYERLLKMKRQREKLAELEQAKAQRAVDTIRLRMADLQQQLARLSDTLTSIVGQTVNPQLWTNHYDLSRRIASAIEEAEKELDLAEVHLQEAMDIRAGFEAEVRALQTMRQQQWELYQKELKKQDQDRLDEFNLRRWMNTVPIPSQTGE